MIQSEDELYQQDKVQDITIGIYYTRFLDKFLINCLIYLLLLSLLCFAMPAKTLLGGKILTLLFDFINGGYEETRTP